MNEDAPTPKATDAPPPARRAADDDLGFELPAPAVLTPTRALALGLLTLIVLGAAFFAIYLTKRHARAVLEADARTSGLAVVRLEVVTPRLGAVDRALLLPGSVRPLEETVIYSRASGYLLRWLVDIGDRVQEEQLLAEIETPEIDQELLQARAQLAQAEARVLQAEATRGFAQSDLARYTQLAPSGIASRADIDQRQSAAAIGVANVAVARAAVGAERANIQRLQQVKSFARVLAPFAGTITARSIDRGALVTAGTATPLFRIAAIDPARIFVQVPQDVAAGVRAGVAARVTLREYPGRVFSGQVARAAGSLDPATRTMNTEVRVPNADGALLGGMYVEVALSLPLPHRVYELPASALLNDASGPRVQVVGEDGTVRITPVVVERDTGATAQISTGLTGRERIVRLANVALAEGTHVEIAPSPPATPGTR